MATASDANPQAARARYLAAFARARSLAIFVGLAGLLPQSCVRSSLGLFGSTHIDLDGSLRMLARGWFSAVHSTPVTIVDIDEATQEAWHHPVATPRPELQRMIAVIGAAKPAAIVVDIDVSWDGQAAAKDSVDRRFRTFLARYSGPAPLIFPKRLEVGADGFRRPVANSLDDLFRSNSKLAWAHAEFVTGGGGAVRTWEEWVPVCLTDGPDWVPSVERAVARAVALDTNRPSNIVAPGAPPVRPTSCASAKPVTNRLILGPRITGPERSGTGDRARAVSAAMLLNSGIARDDSSLFAGRVVLIGATHAEGGDQWMTPAGVIPGVELIASTILYAASKPAEGFMAEAVRRLVGVLLFFLFAATIWYLKGFARPLALITIGLLSTFIALNLGWFGFLGALESALLLTLAFEAIRLLTDFGLDFRDGWRRYGVTEQPATMKAQAARLGHAIANACWRNAEP